MTRSIMAALLTVALLACQSVSAPTSQKARRGAALALGHGESVLFDERLEVQFAGVSEDSRCPRDVTCVWQGHVKVTLHARIDERSPRAHEVIAGETAVIESYRLTVVEVQPERISETQIPQQDYRIVLKAE